MSVESLAARMEEIEEKERRVRRLMSEQGLDAVVLTTQANFAWFTCGGDNRVAIASDVGGTSLVITADAGYIVCDNIEAPRIMDEEIGGQKFTLHTYNWWESGLADEISKLVGGSIGADTPIPGTKPIAGLIAPLRYSLTPQEVDRYRTLGRWTGEALAEVCRSVRPGMTEHEAAGILARHLVDLGIIPGVILIAADERIERYRHPIATGKQVERYVMVVAGARRWGLTVSATRLVHFGPIPAGLRSRHEAVTAVDAELIARTRPGTSVGYILDKGIEAYARWGFADEWKLHHQGGPTGYAGRDYRAVPGMEAVVQPNQAFAWNPSITGTKSEDTIIALEDRTEILSAYGNWPVLPVEAESMVVVRPDILEV